MTELAATCERNCSFKSSDPTLVQHLNPIPKGKKERKKRKKRKEREDWPD
jgi:hypothetical protein